jgi:hypothetical protein
MKKKKIFPRNRSHPLYAKARCDAKVIIPACF